MDTRAARAIRLRGVWMGVADFARSRVFYERLGARYDGAGAIDGIVHATLGDTRLIFEAGAGNARDCGPYLLFDVPDVDALFAALTAAGDHVARPPRNEPWGRQLDVRDPDGHSIALIAPAR